MARRFRISGRRGGGTRSDLAYRYALVVTWIGLIVLFSILRPDTFATRSNFETILGSQSVLVVLSLGLILPLTVGEFDLSIGANLGFSAVVIAVTNVELGWPIGIAVLCGIAAGVTVGSANGLLIVLVGVNAVIATVAMSTLLVGLSFGLTDFITIGGVADPLVEAARTRALGIPLSFYYGIGLAIAMWYVFKYTPIGRHLVFVGRGRDVARLSGLPVQRIRFGSFAVCGLICGVAGAMLTGTLGAADPNSGSSLLLPAYSAAFLGSTAVEPGFFNPWGVVIAVYFLVSTITGLQLLGVPIWIEQVFFGAALAFAVTLSRLVAKRRGE